MASGVPSILEEAAAEQAARNLPGTPMPSKFISFTAKSPRISVTAHPGESAPTVTAGYGNLETVTRPQRRGLTRWTGSDPMQLSIPILLDGFRTGRSVENQIADLERLAGVTGDANPKVTIDSTGNLVPHQDEHKWFVTGLDFGDAILNPNGQRIRQALTVSVTAVVDETTAEWALKNKAGAVKHARSYRVKSGDTLRSISRKVLGDSGRWIEIRRLNNISDPRIVGKPGDKKGAVGTVLKMPR